MNTYMIITLLSVTFAIINGFSFYYLNRQRGAGEKRHKWLRYIGGKTGVIILMGLISSIHTNIILHLLYPVDIIFHVGLTLIEITAYCLLLKPSWGEIFPDGRGTFGEKFAPGVKWMTNILAGYEYNEDISTNKTQVIFWKMVAWVARFGIYGTPMALIKCFLISSALPLIVWWLGALMVGAIYRRNSQRLKGEWLDVAEKEVGAFLGVLVALMLLP